MIDQLARVEGDNITVRYRGFNIQYVFTENRWRVETDVVSELTSLKKAQNEVDGHLSRQQARSSATMQHNVASIKAAVAAMPGLILGLPRQYGKTTAIREMMRDCQLVGGTVGMPKNSVYVSPVNPDHARAAYARLYAGPPWVESPEFLRAESTPSPTDTRPVYIDEWFIMAPEDRKRWLATGRVVCALGTPTEVADQMYQNRIRCRNGSTHQW